MRTKLILALVGIVIAGAAFFAGVLVDRRFPALFASEPNPPALISPAEGALLPNGNLKKDTPISWGFSWSDVPGAKRYQLEVNHPWALYIDVVVDQPQYSVIMGEWTEQVRKGWSWRVRVETSGGWSNWSDPRGFDVAEPGK